MSGLRLSESARRLAAIFILLLVGTTGLVTPRPAAAAVGGNPDFMQVRDNGQLWWYTWTGSRFTGFLVDAGGWEDTKLIAMVGLAKFVEVKGDVLRTWRITLNQSGGFTVTLLETSGPGWGTMRAITNVGDVRGDGGNELIGITANGDLMLYLSRGNGYVWEEKLDNGYEDVRLIAGYADDIPGGNYVLVNDLGDLYICTLQYFSHPHLCTRKMSGWENVRLLSPGGTMPGDTLGDAFVSVRYDGQLVHWHSDGFTLNFAASCLSYPTGCTDTNWFNARLVG